MDITIRKASRTDIPTLFKMIKEFASFLNSLEKIKITEDDFIRDFDSFQCYIAENDKKEPLGYAFFNYIYHTWSGKSIYLEDLYVREKYRRSSVGTMLTCALIDLGRQTNCKSVQWQVLDWNKDAIDFYKKMGATVGDNNINCTYNIS